MANPIALLGLLALAIPIIIHLLGRHQSRVERFPTLRFIGMSRLNPTSRRRISDLLLLLVRMAIVAVAVLALAQPSFTSSRDDSARTTTRVVIVDTSASMRALTASGPPASVIARQIADRESANTIAERVETPSPAAALPGAVAWLASKPGLREIVIVSDFQRSSLDTADLLDIPGDIGVSLHPVVLSETKDPLVAQKQIPRSARDDTGGAQDDVGTFAGPNDVAGADASWRAIGRQRPTDTTGRIAIIYREFPGAARLHGQAVPIDSPWMASLVTTLQRDRTLAEAAGQSSPKGAVRDGADTVAIGQLGRPIIVAGRNNARLQFEVLDDPGSLVSAAFNDALMRAIAPQTPGAEMDPDSWTAEEIGRWQRAATPVEGTAPHGSDGRWLWAAALGLIALETYMRSRTREAVAA